MRFAYRIGSGGWHLNVFLLPNGKPFYGGTYFPPVRAFNRASWKEILLAVGEAYKERRNDLDSQAESLTQHIEQSNAFGIGQSDGQNAFTDKSLQQMAGNITE